jgi:hypothetical protein
MAKKNTNKVNYDIPDQHVSEKGISDFVSDCYAIYGDYVNSSRHIPFMLDGWKPVYKRMILAGMEFSGRLAKTATIAGMAMMKYHPHASQEAVVSALVRYGIFDGKGNHGAYTAIDGMIPEAAPRYTEAKINDVWKGQLSKIIDYVPTFYNDLGYNEPYYIPTPVPMTCVFGASGIGIGLSVSIPAFTMSSLINAYRNNDYHLLEANYGMDIEDKEELASIWNTGEGRITYRYKFEKGMSDDGYIGIWVYGACQIFAPRMTKLNQWKSEGKLLIRDETSGDNGPCVFIARAKRISTITDEEVENEVYKAFTKRKSVKLYTTFNGVTRPIGLYEWINICYQNYENLIQRYKDDKIASIDFQEEVYNHFKNVAQMIINDQEGKYSYADIAKACNTTEDVVSNIAGRTISTLQKLDPEAKIAKLEVDRQNILAINKTQYIDDLVATIG